MSRIQNINQTKILTALRFWFIRKIAGTSVVVLNADIALVPYDGKHAFHIGNINGGLFVNCNFPSDDGMVLHIGQRYREKNS